MKNTISGSPNFGMALHMSPKKKFVKRIGEKATETIIKAKPELEKLAKDVDIHIKPAFDFFESNWTGVDPENIRGIDVRVRKIPTTLKDRLKNFLMDINPFDFRGCRYFYMEHEVENSSFIRAEITPEFLIKHIGRLKKEI